MRILLLTHAFNSLTQRLVAELRQRGHLVSVEFDISDSVTEEAAALFAPDLIVAPYLRRAIPASVWQRYLCLIVHPGVVGDRGPSALDWAILQQHTAWGVTVLQAETEMDAGPVWASAPFAMRAASKASLYRHEVTQAASSAVLQAMAARLAADPELPAQLAAKNAARARDEAVWPLAAYRNEEMTHMQRNFYGFDASYHVARHHFVQKSLASWTPRHLALHRELGWKLP